MVVSNEGLGNERGRAATGLSKRRIDRRGSNIEESACIVKVDQDGRHAKQW